MGGFISEANFIIQVIFFLTVLHQIFIGPRYTWGPIYGSRPMPLTNRACADLTDVKLADVKCRQPLCLWQCFITGSAESHHKHINLKNKPDRAWQCRWWWPSGLWATSSQSWFSGHQRSTWRSPFTSQLPVVTVSQKSFSITTAQCAAHIVLQ